MDEQTDRFRRSSRRRRQDRQSLDRRFDRWVRRTFLYREPARPATHPIPAEPGSPTERRAFLLARLALGVAAPLCCALALVPFRDAITTSTAALILVLPVIVVSLATGVSAGAVAAVTASFAFDVLLTRPYYTATIHAAEDVEAAIVLLVIALITSQVVAREVEARERSTRRLEELNALRSVVRAAARRERDQIVSTAVAAVGAVLDADCTWAPGYHGTARPVMSHDGKVSGRRDDANLPADIELPVVADGVELGRLLLRSHGPAIVSSEERQIASDIAGLLGRCLVDTR